MIVLVGSSPSSGSTMLADLLDSTDATACGPETRIFASQRLYDFPRYARGVGRRSRIASIYVRRCRMNTATLPSYGLDHAAYVRLVREAGDVASFAASFAEHYLAHRGKRSDGIVFEKTPENIQAIGPFLDHVPEGRFVHIVRSPIDVYLSLLRRGFPPFVALATWYVDVAAFMPYMQHPRVSVLRYEDLVEAPFEKVAGLLGSLGVHGTTPDEVERGYRTNTYRAEHTLRLPAWNVREPHAVKRVERRPLRGDEVAALASLSGARLSEAYARHFGLGDVPPFDDVVRAFGYEKELRQVTADAAPHAALGWRDRLLLTRKWLEDALAGDARGRDARAYLHPLAFPAS